MDPTTTHSFEEFLHLLVNELALPVEQAGPDTDLASAGIDSLAVAEMLALFEDLDVIFPDELFTELETLGDIHHFFEVIRSHGIS